MTVDRFAAAFGALLAVVFLGFMAYKIGALPLGIIIVGVLAMMVVDFIQSAKGGDAR